MLKGNSGFCRGNLGTGITTGTITGAGTKTFGGTGSLGGGLRSPHEEGGDGGSAGDEEGAGDAMTSGGDSILFTSSLSTNILNVTRRSERLHTTLVLIILTSSHPACRRNVTPPI